VGPAQSAKEERWGSWLFGAVSSAVVSAAVGFAAFMRLQAERKELEVELTQVGFCPCLALVSGTACAVCLDGLMNSMRRGPRRCEHFGDCSF